MRQSRLIDRVGPNPVIQSLGYADAYLRWPELRAPLPTVPFCYDPRRGIVIPLSLVPSKVQYKVNTANGTPLTTGNFASSCTAGNVMLIGVHYNGTFDDPPSLVGDTFGTSYTSQVSAVSSGSAIRIYSGLLGSSGTNACNCTVAFPANATIVGVEVTGVSSATPSATASAFSSGSVTTLTTGSFSSGANAYIMFMGAYDNASALQNGKINGSAVTVISNTLAADSNGEVGLLEDINASGYSSVTANYDSNGSAGRGAIALVALPASGAAARGLFRVPGITGLGVGGSFFRDPLQSRMH